MSHREKLLLVEDSPTDALIVKHALKSTYDVTHVRSPGEGRDLLLKNDYVAVVTDYYLRGETGLDLQRWISEQRIDVPVIVMSGQGDERVATEALKLGAYDYLIKSEEALASIGVIIEQALRRHTLERRAQILQQIVANAPDSIITMDMDGSILTANHAVELMFEYTPDEVVGKQMSLLFPDLTADSELAQMLTDDGEGAAWQGELNATKGGGAVFPAHVSTSVLRDKSGRPLCLIAIARDETERRDLMEKLQLLSVTDNLTALFNHRYFHDRLQYEFARARRYDESLGCIMMDLDYFKTVNDTYGHLAGDEVLKSVAEIIRAATRSADIVARYGGEEFAILLPNTDLRGAVQCAEHIWESLGTSEIGTRGGVVRLTVSVGVTAMAPDVKDEDEFHHRADIALIEAKQRGRNNVCVWEELSPHQLAPPPLIDGNDVNELCTSLRQTILPARARYLEAARPALESLCQRNPELKRHSANVIRTAMEIARLTTMTPAEKEALHHAAKFHDIGHILTPPDILAKSDKLTHEEMAVMREHVEVSERLIAELKALDLEQQYVQHHHERYDGGGYPKGLAGEEIPLGARILAVADAFEAMIAGRPYREPMTETEVIAELRNNAGTQFDPQLVKLFVDSRRGNRAAAANKPERAAPQATLGRTR